MPKLSIERFREIKARAEEVNDLIDKIENEEIELTDQESDEIESELEQIVAEVHSSDLSDIPFEEYEGFCDFGFEFSGTGANIDLNLFRQASIYSTVRLKGCNVRNFDFDKFPYDEDSFDEEFMDQHPDRFISRELPKDVRQAYYLKNLQISDVIRYELYDAIQQGRIDKRTTKFWEKIQPDVARTIEPNLFDNYDLKYSIISSIEGYSGEVTEDVVKAIITRNLAHFLSDEERYIPVDRYDEERHLTIDGYKSIMKNPKIREYIPEEQRIDFGENDELGLTYWRGQLDLLDVFNNQDLFRGKKFVSKLLQYKLYQEAYEGITEEKIFYIFEQFPDIADAISSSIRKSNSLQLLNLISNIDIEVPREENLKGIQTQIIEKLDSDNAKSLAPDVTRILERYYSIEAAKRKLSDYGKSEVDIIMKYTTQEKIQEYGISPRLFENDSARTLFYKYGLETVMEFDRANGNIFSKYDFDLAKNMFTYYFHYAGNEHNPNRKIFHRSEQPEDWNAPYSMDDFEECIRRMIVQGPTDWTCKKKQPIDYRNFSQEFKDKFPTMFLTEDAPQDLQDKFYTKTIDIGDFAIHPEWISFLEGKDFELGIDGPNVKFESMDLSEWATVYDELKKLNSSESDILNFIRNNAKTIKMMELYQKKMGNATRLPLEEIKTLDDFKDFLDNTVETQILSGYLEYGEPYISEVFKTKHPDLVLDENAPEELKAKFYSLYFEKGNDRNRASLYNFTLQDLVNEKYQEFLTGKSFDLLKNADAVKNITQLFDMQTITDLYKIDSSAFEIYCLNAENVGILKDVLDNYPEQYAKEELMKGQKLSKEEFEARLEDKDFKDKFESLKRGYAEDLVKNPGFVLHLDPEKRSREALKHYKDLSASNMLHNSNSFSRDSYEQILGHMLGFLGYDEAKRLLAVPAIDEETLNGIYTHDEAIKSLYEKKFEVTGNLKVISKLIEGFPGLMPTSEKLLSKANCKLFMSMNKRIQEGYNKDITSLITEILVENGVELDNDKINQLVKKTIGISTAQKLDLVRENNSMVIDTSIEENQKTKNMIKTHYRNALEYSLNEAERVDPNLVKEYLTKEFGRVGEDGQAYYSPHVTEHLEDLVAFAGELTSNPEWSSKLNHSVVDDLKVEAGKIGKGWIRKIAQNLCNKPEKLTYEEAENLDTIIYPEDSGLEVDTKATVGLKKLNEEEKANVYKILTDENYRGLFTYGKAENMFSAIKPPYSEKFKQYFLKYKDEFISNPDLYAKFPIIASRFDDYMEEVGFNTRYAEGTLTPEDILLKLEKEVYPNLVVGKGEHEVVYQARGAGLSEEQVGIALKLFKNMKEREYQTVPPEEVRTSHYRGRIVRMDDPLHFSIGEITNCCQTIGQSEPGETSMIHSASERNGALFVVEELDETGRPIRYVAQSWTWRNGNRVCFDNVEIPHEVANEYSKIGGFDEIMEAYQEAAERMIETDRIKLSKLLEAGKITDEQYQSILIKDVTMGVGCDDLIRNLSKGKKASMSRLTPVPPLEIGKTYTGAGSRTLYSDSQEGVVLIAHNDDFAPNDHEHINDEVGDYGVRYVKTRGIYRRKGFDIDSDKIETISTMVQKEGREESSFADNPLNISEVASHFGIHTLGDSDAGTLRISMSDTGDWYVLSEEAESGIIMLESGIDTTKAETEVEKKDRKMALSEYTREIHKIMLEASKNGKAMTIDSYSLNQLINLESLINDGIISLEDGVILVKDAEKLEKVVEEYDKVIDDQRRERMTITDEEKTHTSA